MKDAAPDSPTQRLTRLECDNRRIKRYGALVVLLMAAVALIGQVSKDRVVQAQQFILLDATGTVRAGLDATDGYPALRLTDRNGKTRASLAVLEDGTPVLALIDAGGLAGAWLHAKEGAPILQLQDSSGTKAEVGLHADGTPGLTLSERGQKRAALSIHNKSPILVLWDKDFERDQKGYLMAGIMPGGPLLSLQDKDGQVVWKAP